MLELPAQFLEWHREVSNENQELVTSLVQVGTHREISELQA